MSGTGVLEAQEPPIRFELRAAASAVRPGDAVGLTLTAWIPRGWHLYGMRQSPDGPVATRIEVGPQPLFTAASSVVASAAKAAFDPNFGLLVEWHADSAVFRVPVRAARTTLPGTYAVQVRISYQRCNDRICLPLAADTLRVALTVGGAPVREPSKTNRPAG